MTRTEIGHKIDLVREHIRNLISYEDYDNKDMDIETLCFELDFWEGIYLQHKY